MIVGGSASNYREQPKVHNNNQQTSLSNDNDPLDNYLSQDRNASSRAIQEVASSALIDSLAAEWWSLNLSQTVINDLLENLIPLVVLGCEKVINEADERHLIGTATPDRSFNPINRLASFLMRNNPKYMHYSTLSPYHYSMKSLLNTKKIQVLKVYGEEETLLRTILQQRQNERTEHRDVTNKEEERRKTLLKTLFSDWNVPDRGWIQTKLVNNMLEQFHEIPKEADLKSKLSAFQSQRMHLGTFTDNFYNGMSSQSAKDFDAIIHIYRRCAQTYSNIVQEHELDLLLQRVFNHLDDKQSGYLLRKNVMKTLKKFYNALNDPDKKHVNKPDQWPVVKQITLDDDTLDETSSEPEKTEEKPAEVAGTNEHEKPSGERGTHEHEKVAESHEHDKPIDASKTHEHEKPGEESKTHDHEKPSEASKTNEHEKTGEASKTNEHEKPGDVAKPSEHDKPPERPKTNEHKVPPSTLADNHEKKDANEKKDVSKQKEDEQEETDDEDNNVAIELKPSSAYEANYRFSKEQKSVYNLEHFDTFDVHKSIPFDEYLIDKKQFSSLLTSFAGVKKNEMIVSALIDYFRITYKENDDDRNGKKTLLHQQLIDEQRRGQCDVVFEKIDTACTGLIKLEPLTNILKQYKEGTVTEPIEEVLETYQYQAHLSSEQFYDFLIRIYHTVNYALGGEEKFDELVKYIDSQQPQINQADRTRINTRQQWLRRIRNIPFRTLGHLYKDVMDIIQKDSDTFGNQPSKHLSIYIALLDNDKNHLRYVATTNDQTDLLLGKTLSRDQGISFQVLENGKWAYINQTKNHSRIHFFNPDAKHDSGSFVLLPLKRLQGKYSNGLLGIDTIQEKKAKAFVKHEVQFYEGITAVLSDTFTFIDFHNNVIKILHRFTHWIKQRHVPIVSIDYYTYEPASVINPQERLLQHVLTYSNGKMTKFDTPKVINSREQVFKYYLEHAATTCQSTVTSFLDQTHMIQAMRGRDHFCFGLIDTNIGEKEELPHEQKEDLIAMYHCVNQAVDVLGQELYEDKTKRLLFYENQSEEKRLNYLFDRIWYRNICNEIKELSTEKIQEFINNKPKWNDQTKGILSTISHVVKGRDLNPTDYAKDLIPAMRLFDPTTTEAAQNDAWNHVEQSISKIDKSTWQQHSSDLMKIFYDWLTLAYELHQISHVQ